MSWGNANDPINGPYQSFYLKPPDGHAHTHTNTCTHTQGATKQTLSDREDISAETPNQIIETQATKESRTKKNQKHEARHAQA